MSSQLKLAPPYTLGRSGPGGIKFGPTSVKETDHIWFHFLFPFHCTFPSVAGDGISVFPFNMAGVLWVIQAEGSCASLCTRCRQHRTTFRSAVGKGGKSSVSAAAGRCPCCSAGTQGWGDGEGMLELERNRKHR